MSRQPEFDIDAIGRETKEIRSFSVDLPEGLADLPRGSFLASSGFCPEDRIAAEMALRFDGETLSMPVLTARGREDGPTLVVTAGVHGDEYEGMEAIYRTYEALDPGSLTGTFVAVPIVTLTAFWLGIRCNPVDSLNMARVFPGSTDGSFSQRLARAVLQRVLRHADFYIDLHSSGRNYHMLTLCGYSMLGEQAAVAREAALAFGAPVVWAHPNTSAGRTLSATLDLGIPSLYTEAYGAGHVRPEDVDCYTQGLANLLKFLDMTVLKGAGLPAGYRPWLLGGSGDMDVAIKCRQGGLFFAALEIGARVRRGDLLGIIRSLDGRVVEEITAPAEGVLMLMRATPRIYPGENIAALASEA
ncbi:MAG: M14 family metallopeptidase [Acidobacteria bacterium]|nr:M14 family metallopeptidase [Acidobacteriota bacterium]